MRGAASYDGRPQSASVRVNSTYDGTIIAGLSWQNGWGGVAGSMADRTMRKDLTQAATEIAEELTKRLRTPIMDLEREGPRTQAGSNQ